MVSPFKELNGPLYGKTSVPFNQECCVESWTEIGPMLLEKTVLNFVNVFFVIISPWKWTGPFFWTNLNSLHARMLYAKFGWYLIHGSGTKILKFRQCIYFVIFFPSEKGLLIWTNLNSHHSRMLWAKFRFVSLTKYRYKMFSFFCSSAKFIFKTCINSLSLECLHFVQHVHC